MDAFVADEPSGLKLIRMYVDDFTVTFQFNRKTTTKEAHIKRKPWCYNLALGTNLRNLSIKNTRLLAVQIQLGVALRTSMKDGQETVISQQICMTYSVKCTPSLIASLLSIASATLHMLRKDRPAA